MAAKLVDKTLPCLQVLDESCPGLILHTTPNLRPYSLTYQVRDSIPTRSNTDLLRNLFKRWNKTGFKGGSVSAHSYPPVSTSSQNQSTNMKKRYTTKGKKKKGRKSQKSEKPDKHHILASMSILVHEKGAQFLSNFCHGKYYYGHVGREVKVK